MKENKKTQQKYEIYEDTIMIMRQLFGTRLTSRPGYILLQDVIYKHLKENGKMSVEKLVKWAGKHFVFSMSKDMAYERIEEFLETQKDISDSMEKEIEKVLKEAESIYYRKKMYASVVNALDKPGEDFTEDDQQLIIKLLFELKKGINLEEAIIKVANEELPKDENPEEKIKEIIKVSFDSEEGLLDFLKTI